MAILVAHELFFFQGYVRYLVDFMMLGILGIILFKFLNSQVYMKFCTNCITQTPWTSST